MANTWRYISGSLAALWSLLLLVLGVWWFTKIMDSSAALAVWTLAIVPTILGAINLANTVLFFQKKRSGSALSAIVLASVVVFILVGFWAVTEIEEAAMCGGGG